MENLPEVKKNSLSADVGGEFVNVPVAQVNPECVIGEKMNRRRLEPGKFNFEAALEWPATDKLVGVSMLRSSMSRVMYGETFDSPSRCGSDDYKVPSHRYQEPISRSCEQCPMKGWDDKLSPEDLQFKRNVQNMMKRKQQDIVSGKPDCNDSLNLLLIDERNIPFVLKVTKTKVRQVQQGLINRLRFKSAKGKRAFQTTFDVSIKEKNKGYVSYYELIFDNFRDSDESRIPVLSEAYESTEHWVEALSQMHEQQDAAKVRDVGGSDGAPF